MGYKRKEAKRKAWEDWYAKNKERESKRKKEAYQERKALMDALRDTPCPDCGRKYPPECMDFHHVDGDKLGTVSYMKRCSLKKFMAEVAKCDILCSNCHRIRHKLGR